MMTMMSEPELMEFKNHWNDDKQTQSSAHDGAFMSAAHNQRHVAE